MNNGQEGLQNHGSEPFCPPPPPPQDRVKLFPAPHPSYRVETFCSPPPSSVWLKLQANVLKLPQNWLCPPFGMAKTFSAPSPSS